MVKTETTEELILRSAIKVFISKGFEGARMQEIANHAGINKALLHYYFRSKEKLFGAVFDNTLSMIGPVLITLFNEDIPLEVKVWKFVDKYIEMIKDNPNLPLFILNEISINPDRMIKYMNLTKYVNFVNLEKQLSDEYKKGNIRKVDVKHFVINILGMIVFPFAAKVIIQKNMEISEKEWEVFLDERKKIIPETIMNWIKIKS
jgi:AcrR family transcriptional regulator